MTDWAWLVVEGADTDPRPDAWVSTVGEATDGGPDLRLSGYPHGRKPAAGAVRMHAGVLDPTGEAAAIGLLVLGPAEAPLFDDPAVTELLRAVLRGAAGDGFTTFVRDATGFAGGLVVSRSGQVARHPLGRFGVLRVLEVRPGFVGRQPAPAGPAVQRYSGAPWPLAGFANAMRASR